MAGLGMASEVHHVIEVPAIGKLNVYVQGNLLSHSVAFLTVHDLGCNHYQYEDFVSHRKLRPINERALWISIDLPGQGDGEEELPATRGNEFLKKMELDEACIQQHLELDVIYEKIPDKFMQGNVEILGKCTDLIFLQKYTFPTIQTIAENLKPVLDHFRLDHVVLFGEGAGANILARFAMIHDEMVLGAILIHCTGQTASFADSLRDKLVNWKLNTTGMNASTESFLILHRFGWITDTGTEHELRQSIEHFRENLRHSINPKNLNRYITAYMQRKTLIDRLAELKCSVLLITGALAPQRKGCEKLYECLRKAHKDNENSMSTRELVVIENVANVLVERPDKVIESMQYFIQGIGLLSHVKMQTTPLSLNRRMSMEDYDRPLGKIQLSAGFRSSLLTMDVIEDKE